MVRDIHVKTIFLKIENRPVVDGPLDYGGELGHQSSRRFGGLAKLAQTLMLPLSKVSRPGIGYESASRCNAGATPTPVVPPACDTRRSASLRREAPRVCEVHERRRPTPCGISELEGWTKANVSTLADAAGELSGLLDVLRHLRQYPRPECLSWSLCSFCMPFVRDHGLALGRLMDCCGWLPDGRATGCGRWDDGSGMDARRIAGGGMMARDWSGDGGRVGMGWGRFGGEKGRRWVRDGVRLGFWVGKGVLGWGF